MQEAIGASEADATAWVREQTGDDTLTVEFDTKPLLRTEKKWPEDFRGFGSNVRPKKQRR